MSTTITLLFTEAPTERISLADMQGHAWLGGAENEKAASISSDQLDEDVMTKLLELGKD